MSFVDDLESGFDKVTRSLRILSHADDLVQELIPTTTSPADDAGEAEPDDEPGKATKGPQR